LLQSERGSRVPVSSRAKAAMAVATAGYPTDVLDDTLVYKPKDQLLDTRVIDRAEKNDQLLDTKVIDREDKLNETKVIDRQSQAGVPPGQGFASKVQAKIDDVENELYYSGAVFGPDGMPLDQGASVEVDEEGEVHAKVEDHQKFEIHDQGWFHAESNRYEQEELAKRHLMTLTSAVMQRQQAGLCRDGRWVNCPNEFPDLGLTGTLISNALAPFSPNDQQYFIKGKYDPEKSQLRSTAVPVFGHDGHDSSVWMRLVDFAQHADAVHLFDEFTCKPHCGRIFQGSLDNGYFVEALNAITLRPKLVKQLFYGWQTRKSIYIARLFKHGTWMRVEVDDYVPVGRPGRDDVDTNVPICCRSEYFPNVLWPSLIEKAYAKIHTMRLSASAISSDDLGGWEALNGGGKVEDALSDLTGGVAGRFNTWDVSPDRLFIYIYELQRDTLFVCRPNQETCELQGVRLNPYYSYAVNRAVQWEGGLYFQLFCGAPGIYDGGLEDITVPYTLSHCELYSEPKADGFFWVNHADFHEYFGTIFECRLVNSGDVSLPNMPSPRFDIVRPPAANADQPAGMMAPGAFPGMTATDKMALPDNVTEQGWEDLTGSDFLRKGVQHLAMDGTPLAWYEWVFANPGDIARQNEPEFSIQVPQNDVPCEIICSIEQFDPRMLLSEPKRPACVPILCKVYEKVEGENYYSDQIVCRSNWLPVRDAMVAFSVRRGGEFLITAELPDGKRHINRMIFRCYASRPNVMVAAHKMSRRHLLVKPRELPACGRLSLIGLMEPDGADTDKPIELDWEHDAMRKPEFDMEGGFRSLVNEVKEDCSIM